MDSGCIIQGWWSQCLAWSRWPIGLFCEDRPHRYSLWMEQCRKCPCCGWFFYLFIHLPMGEALLSFWCPCLLKTTAHRLCELDYSHASLQLFMTFSWSDRAQTYLGWFRLSFFIWPSSLVYKDCTWLHIAHPFFIICSKFCALINAISQWLEWIIPSAIFPPVYFLEWCINRHTPVCSPTSMSSTGSKLLLFPPVEPW